MLARLIESLLRSPAPRQILLVNVPTDGAALEQRAAAARQQLGARWLCHPDNRVLSEAQRAERARRELAAATNLRTLRKKG